MKSNAPRFRFSMASIIAAVALITTITASRVFADDDFLGNSNPQLPELDIKNGRSAEVKGASTNGSGYSGATTDSRTTQGQEKPRAQNGSKGKEPCVRNQYTGALAGMYNASALLAPCP